MPIVLCKDCAYWKAPRNRQHLGPDQKQGECHLTVPLNVQITTGGQKVIWPLTYDEDGCGAGEPVKEASDAGTRIGATSSGGAGDCVSDHGAPDALVGSDVASQDVGTS